MIINSEVPEGASADIVVKTPESGGEVSAYEVGKLMEITRAGLRKEVDVKVLIPLAAKGDWLQDFLRRSRLADEKMIECFKIWALNIWQIGWGINEGQIPDSHQKAGLHRKDFNDARMFARVDEAEIERRIDELAQADDLSKRSFRETFVTARKARSSGAASDSTEDSSFEPTIIEEDAALVGLYESMLHNPGHFLDRRYQQDLGYRQVVANEKNRQMIRWCLKHLLEDLEAKDLEEARHAFA